MFPANRKRWTDPFSCPPTNHIRQPTEVLTALPARLLSNPLYYTDSSSLPTFLPSIQLAYIHIYVYMIHSCTHRHSAEPRSIIKQPPDLCIPPALLTIAFTISLPLYDDLSRFLSPRMVAVHPFSVSPLSLSAVSRLIWHLPRCNLALFHRHIVVPVVFDRFTEHNKLRGDGRHPRGWHLGTHRW